MEKALTSYSSLLKAPTSTFTIRNLLRHYAIQCVVFGAFDKMQNIDCKNFREISLTPKYSNNVIAGIYVLSGHPLWSCIATIYDFVITHNCGKWEM